MERNNNNSQSRNSIRTRITVDIIQKQDQRSGKRTRGKVQEILTNSLSHPHGIKVRLTDGRVGRVIEILPLQAKNKDDKNNLQDSG